MSTGTVTNEFQLLRTAIRETIDGFLADDTAFVEGFNKTAGKRARLALGELKKLTTNYRKHSVEMEKTIKK